MGPRGVGEPEGFLKEQLARGAGQEVVAANDFGDAVRVVVDDYGELIRRGAAAACDQEIADRGGDVERLLACDLVVEAHDALAHEQADARAPPGLGFGFGE